MNQNKNRVTLQNVAEKANVSVSSVSHYLNKRKHFLGKETQKEIKKAIEELNYVPDSAAQTLGRGKASTIGVIASLFQKREMDYLRGGTIIRRKLAAFYNKLENEEFHLIFSSPLEEQEFSKAIRMFKAARVAGIILLNEIETSEEKELITEMADNNIPIISLYHPEFDFDLDINYVETDRFEAGRLVGNHFFRSKHKKVSVIGSYTESESFKKKLFGFEKACREKNLIIRNVYEGAIDYDSAYNVCHEALRKKDSSTAFFCHNDETAIAFIRAANNLAIKIPQEVAVVGFDNTEITKYMIPAISSVEQPCSKIGKFAADSLIKQIKGEGEKKCCVKIFPSTLKIRTSSKN